MWNIGKVISVDFEDIRPPFSDDTFAKMVQESINILDGELEAALDDSHVLTELSAEQVIAGSF